jgi:hypothetical protein
MASTVLDLINGAMRKIGVLAPGNSLAGQEASDALQTLNEMLSSWSIEGMMILAPTREVFNLAASTGSYTIGPGQTFDTTRPVRITEASVIPNADGIEHPLTIIRDSGEWAGITSKSTESLYPSHLFYQPAETTGTIYVYDVPDSSTPDLVLYSEKALTQYSALTDSVSLAPGYERAIKYNLAIEYAGEYGKEPSPSVVLVANESKAFIKTKNLQIPVLGCDAALLAMSGCGGYCILTDR